jgi:hypothetical protein
MASKATSRAREAPYLRLLTLAPAERARWAYRGRLGGEPALGSRAEVARWRGERPAPRRRGED